MAALIRRGGKRIGGSVLQRTQAAVTSPAFTAERRLLVPRRMYSVDQHPLAPRQVVQQIKEELYDSLSKVENWRNRRLLMDLAVQVKPRPDTQWRRLRATKWATNLVRAVAGASFATGAVVGFDLIGRKVKSYVAEKKMAAEALMPDEDD